jgi:cytochrome d ubiquinol oxidase subunit II
VSLEEIPMIFILLGLVFYIVLGGADFGAAIWQVASGRGERGDHLRELAHEAMAPVWEANHVWLIFVLTVTWTAYPAAFGSLASTLSIPLFVAGIGLIIRGAAYALRSGTSDPREMRRIDTASAISSVLTPFMLGAAIGGLASGRVPYGNAKGDLITSWLNATSILIGVLAVVFCAYLAAVYLCADAVRRGEDELVDPLRARALATGALAGLLAVAGLIVLRHDARELYDELLTGDGLPALIVSVLAGAATMALVLVRRFEPARFSAALAVAAIVAGWALAQQPRFLPGLTIEQAAAPDATLWAVIIAVLGGALVLFPSLALLFRLTLGGRLGYGEAESAMEQQPPRRALLLASRAGLLGRAAAALFLMGVAFLTILEPSWAHVIGVVALLACVPTAVAAAVPAFVGEEEGGGGPVAPAR